MNENLKKGLEEYRNKIESGEIERPKRSGKFEHTMRNRNGGLQTEVVTKTLAIKIFCTQCTGWEVHPKDCTATTCPLYPFRGKSQKLG